MSRPTNRFIRGQSVYTCRICKRSTRQTGRGDNEHVLLCADCFDLAGIENAICDSSGAELDRYRDEAKRLLAEIRSKGGTPSFEYESRL